MLKTNEYRECPRCGGESTFRENHLMCVRCGLSYSLNGTFTNDKWLLSTPERSVIAQLWAWFNHGSQIGGMSIEEYLQHAHPKSDVLTLMSWLDKVGESP